jgi:hypothetical protein
MITNTYQLMIDVEWIDRENELSLRQFELALAPWSPASPPKQLLEAEVVLPQYLPNRLSGALASVRVGRWR